MIYRTVWVEELGFREACTAWNELWDASEATLPNSRSEGVELWMRHFHVDGSWGAILVYDQSERLVGGLAVAKSRRRGIPTLNLPNNCWAAAGELLVHPQADFEHVIDSIVDELGNHCRAICFDGVPMDWPRWGEFIEAMRRKGHAPTATRVERVGVVDVASDWDAYYSCLSGNHRRAIRSTEKKITKAGQHEVLRLNSLTAAEAESWMRKIIQLEHYSWKGESGTSILATPGMDQYFLAEAEMARQCGTLEIWLLMLDDQPIAFEYCHKSKGVCTSHKIGYDRRQKKLGPGRLLRKLQLEEMARHCDPAKPQVLDMAGTLCPTKAKWATREYNTARLMASLGGVRACLELEVLNMVRSLRSLVKSEEKESDLSLGGASFQAPESDESTAKGAEPQS